MLQAQTALTMIGQNRPNRSPTLDEQKRTSPEKKKGSKSLHLIEHVRVVEVALFSQQCAQVALESFRHAVSKDKVLRAAALSASGGSLRGFNPTIVRLLIVSSNQMRTGHE